MTRYVRSSSRSVLVLLLTAVAGLPAAVVWPEGSSREVDVGLGQESVRVVFPVRNDHSGELVIERVKTTCGCTTVEDQVQRIAPGATGEVAVTFTVGSRTGNVRKRATVHYQLEDGAAGEQELDMRFAIERLVASDSSVIAFHSREPDPDWMTRQLAVRVLDPTVMVTGLDAGEAPHFSAVLKRGEEPGTWTIEVTPQAGLRAVRLLEPVYLITDHPLERYRRIRYHCYLLHEVEDGD